MTPTFLLISISALFLTATVGAPSTPSPEACVADLVAFSPCFGYVLAPPNNVMDGVNPQCCKAVTEAFGSGGSNCFCHLVKQPLLFGFPLNQTKIGYLPSLCSNRKSKNATSGMANFHSLETLCAGLPPPPSSPSLVGAPTSSDSGLDNYTSPENDPPTEPSEVSTIFGAHNTTLAAPEPPAKAGKPAPDASSTPSPSDAYAQVSSPPASSMAAELSSIPTWFFHGAVLQLLLSLV